MEYNPFLPEVKQNPYPYYAWLRREQPVYRIEALGIYAVSRYDDVVSVLTRPDLFSSGLYGQVEIEDRPTTMMIFSDPPDHTRLRSVVSRAFTPKTVADLEPRIRQLTRELIGRVAGSGEMDLIADLATPLPVTVIAELLGVGPERGEEFKRWSDNTIAQVFGNANEEEHEQVHREVATLAADPGAEVSPQAREHQRLHREMDEFEGFFQEAMEERRRAPRNDLISALVRAESEQQKLTADEVVAFIGLLLVAGNETTTNLIGNAIVALLDHPDQLERVLSEPSLVPNMVEEALRYDAPVQFLFRVTTEEVELAGTTIPKGATVLPLFASANRDEGRFADPERFDVGRDASGHVAFGHGIHFCLGAPLARLEAKIALEALLFRLRGLRRVDETLELIPSLFLRGPKRLPLTFTPVDGHGEVAVS